MNAAHKAWLDSLAPYALQAAKAWPGMRPSVCLAQAAVESAWGAKTIGGWNLWGIKDVGWNPGHVDVPTHEWVNGKLVPCVAEFEDMATPEEGFAVYARLVTRAKPYADTWGLMDLETYVRRLARHYSTHPDYGTVLLTIIQAHGLEQYDTERG